MRRTIILILFVGASLSVAGQDEAATSAPILNPFNLKGDELGSMASYVNQLTGEVVFPINLVSIPGPGGLGINASIAYNSANIENLINIWNQEAPTGVLGLGWSMDTPLIMVDNKQTGAREDDDFYLVDGGSSTRLVCVGVNGGVRSYQTATFSNWIIQYTESVEKWEVTKDDGTKFIYGDTQGTANSVQWTARWGNWMGQSTASGHQLQALIWNLREVRSVWGDRITYSYLIGNISYGQGTLATEYSLLYKINDSWGHEVEFVPGQKLTDEYQNPPGVVLNRTERFFINKILVRTNAVLDYELQLEYSTSALGTGQLTKRLLQSIKKVFPAGTIESTVSFEYATVSEGNKGALYRVLLPTGGTITFTYSTTGPTYQKQVPITENAPSGYAEPDVYISDDYALVTWRELSGSSHIEGPMNTVAHVIEWGGKWRTVDLGSIGGVKFLNNAKDYRVALGKDFLAILIPSYTSSWYTLRIWHKNPGANGEWVSHPFVSLDMGSYIDYRVSLFAGNNFICATNNNGKLFRFVWNGKGWNRTDVNEGTGIHWTTATNNYILSHDPTPEPDVITIYYLDQLQNWQTRSQSIPGFFVGAGETYWYASNSSAFVMANQSNEMVIQWDENYNNITKVDQGWYYGDNSKVYFDGTTLGLVTQVYAAFPPNPPLYSKSRAARRAGNSWVDSGEKTNGVFGWADEGELATPFGMASFGPELMLWNSNINFSAPYYFKYQTFNLVTSQWSSEIQLTNSDNPHVNVGPDYFAVGRKIYMSRSTGYSLATYQNLSGNDDVFPSSRKFIASASKLIWLKNGDTYTYEPNGGRYRVRNSTSHPYRYLAGTSIYALCTSGFEDHFQDDVLLLFRRVTSRDTLRDFPVIKVQVDDGTNLQYVSFAYANPVFGPNEASVMYNKVTSVPGSATAVTRPFGHTDTYFWNSQRASELSPYPVELTEGNGYQYSNLLTGQAYLTEVFDAPGQLVSTTTALVSVTNDTITKPNGLYLSSTPRPFKTITSVSGKTEVTELSFKLTGRRELIRSTRSTKYQYPIAYWDQRYEEPTYGWQVYPSMDSLNMLSQTVLTKQGITGGSVTHAEAVRWKSWTCSGTYCAASTIPAPFDQYSWRGTNSSNFTTWDVATQTPSADWRLGQMVLTRDAITGLELEVSAKGNERAATVLDNLKRPIASVSNAAIYDISFSSFEDGTTGLWNSSDGTVSTGSARTGTRYHSLGTTGLSRPGLNSSTAYRLTFWAKSSGGSVTIDGVGTVSLGSLADWTLFQYSITGVSSIGIRRNGSTEVLLDEVRLHPANSMMSTNTYHATFGVDSETDANNRTMFTEFDEFGQPKLIRDQNKYIVKHFFTNRK